MAIAARLSQRRGALATGDTARLVDLLQRSGLPVAAPAMPLERWLKLMAQDKKVADGAIRFVLLEALGWAVIAGDVASDDLAAVLG